MQPGDTIDPGAEPPKESNEPAVEKAQDAAAVPEQQPPEATPDSHWQFTADEEKPSSSSPKSHEPVGWTASEYVAHEKTIGWYLLLALIVIAITALVYFVTRERISAAVIVVMGVAFGAFAARPPQELDYRLDNTGLHIGGRVYTYAQFKSFTVVDEGPIHSIMLLPMQRFMPPLSIYYAPEDEAKIADALSSYLPHEDRKQDVVDKLMSKIRF